MRTIFLPDGFFKRWKRAVKCAVETTGGVGRVSFTVEVMLVDGVLTLRKAPHHQTGQRTEPEARRTAYIYNCIQSGEAPKAARSSPRMTCETFTRKSSKSPLSMHRFQGTSSVSSPTCEISLTSKTDSTRKSSMNFAR